MIPVNSNQQTLPALLAIVGRQLDAALASVVALSMAFREKGKPVVVELEPIPVRALSPALQSLLARRPNTAADPENIALIERATAAYNRRHKSPSRVPVPRHSDVTRDDNGVLVGLGDRKGCIANYKVRNDGRLRFINEVTQARRKLSPVEGASFGPGPRHRELIAKASLAFARTPAGKYLTPSPDACAVLHTQDGRRIRLADARDNTLAVYHVRNCGRLIPVRLGSGRLENQRVKRVMEDNAANSKPSMPRVRVRAVYRSTELPRH